MNQTEITKMITEIIQDFTFYIYENITNLRIYKNYEGVEFDADMILQIFLDIHQDEQIDCIIFDLFKRHKNFEKIKKIIYNEFFYMDDNYEPNYKHFLITQYDSIYISRFFEIELNNPTIIDYINNILFNLQPMLK